MGSCGHMAERLKQLENLMLVVHWWFWWSLYLNLFRFCALNFLLVLPFCTRFFLPWGTRSMEQSKCWKDEELVQSLPDGKCFTTWHLGKMDDEMGIYVGITSQCWDSQKALQTCFSWHAKVLMRSQLVMACVWEESRTLGLSMWTVADLEEIWFSAQPCTTSRCVVAASGGGLCQWSRGISEGQEIQHFGHDFQPNLNLCVAMFNPSRPSGMMIWLWWRTKNISASTTSPKKAISLHVSNSRTMWSRLSWEL